MDRQVMQSMLEKLRHVAEHTIVRDLTISPELFGRITKQMYGRTDSMRGQQRGLISRMANVTGTLVAAILFVCMIAGGTFVSNHQRSAAGPAATSVNLKVQADSYTPVTRSNVMETIKTLHARLLTMHYNSAVVSMLGADTIHVALPAQANTDTVLSTITQESNLSVYGHAIREQDGAVKPDVSSLLMSGDDWKNAYVVKAPTHGLVTVATNSAKLKEVTTRYRGTEVYTFYNGKLISESLITSVIDFGKMELSGDKSLRYFSELAAQIAAGYQPYRLVLVH